VGPLNALITDNTTEIAKSPRTTKATTSGII
jgi:hypothetical protein